MGGVTRSELVTAVTNAGGFGFLGMVRDAGTPLSQPWKTFLLNQAEAISAIDMCVVLRLTFDLLFAFLVLIAALQETLTLKPAPTD
jgi:nitronate monooxygenase